jgi:hypothetical protein
MNREYEVTIKFKISGDMHDRIVDKHIKDNMIDEISSAIGEFEMHHEYYGDFDEISTMFLDGDIELVRFHELEPQENVIDSRITKPTSMNERQNASNILQGYLDTIKNAKGDGK